MAAASKKFFEILAKTQEERNPAKGGSVFGKAKPMVGATVHTPIGLLRKSRCASGPPLLRFETHGYSSGILDSQKRAVDGRMCGSNAG